MSIYTKTGDSGTTSLFGGKRVKKSDCQIAAYGAVDELTSYFGLVEAKRIDGKEKKFITMIQNDLYQIMAYLAGYPTLDTQKLTSFILPQGGETSALFHVTRTICRRAEREVIKLYPKKLHVTRYTLQVIQYLNRLSDLLFMLARKHSLQEKKAKYT